MDSLLELLICYLAALLLLDAYTRQQKLSMIQTATIARSLHGINNGNLHLPPHQQQSALQLSLDVTFPIFPWWVSIQEYEQHQYGFNWLIGVLTARQLRKVNLCQLRGKETGSVG